MESRSAAPRKSTSRPITAVDNLSFSVGRGEVLGFLGPNGAGKSTTMKMITGFLTPSRGTAVVAGFDVTKDPIEVQRRVGYLPEGAPLYGEMTPKTLLEFVAQVANIVKWIVHLTIVFSL